MSESLSTLETIASSCPRTVLDAGMQGNLQVVGFHRPCGEGWIALNGQPDPKPLGEILAYLANRLVLCQNCSNVSEDACRYEHKVTARRLRTLLGERGYATFLANAPIRVGSRGENNHSESLLQQIIDLIPYMIFVRDEHGRFVFANRTLAEAYGTTVERLVGSKHADHHSPEKDLQYFLKDDLDVLERGETTSTLEKPAMDGHGELHLVQTTKIPFIARESARRAVLGVAVDVSELKHPEEALWERERKLATLVDDLPGMAYRCSSNNKKRRMEFVSKGCLRLTGYEPSDLVRNQTLSYDDLIHPDDRKSVQDQIQRALAENRPSQLAYRICTASGEEKWVWEQGARVLSETGSVDALDGFVTNITEYKRIEATLRTTQERLKSQLEERTAELGTLRSLVVRETAKREEAEEGLLRTEERFTLAVNGTDGGIWNWDLRTNELYLSAGWKSMLGFQAGEVGNSYSEWENRLHADDREGVLATVRDCLEGNSSHYMLEHRLRRKDGSYRWVLARGIAVRDREGRPVRIVGSSIDITEKKQVEEALREKEAQLLAAQRIQEQLLPNAAPTLPGFDIAGVSHPAEFAAGDYFDYLPMPDESMGFAIADVSGHGFAPALVMASTRALVRSLTKTHTKVDEILAVANSVLTEETEEDRFVTLLLGRLDPWTRSFVYASAGHPTGYVFDSSGVVKAHLESTGFPLGIVPQAEFPIADEIVLEAGDMVLLLTDGFQEARSPQGVHFGTQRALELVRINRRRTASEIVESLYQAVRQFSGQERMADDITVVVIKVRFPT